MARYLSNELAGTTTGLTIASSVQPGYRPIATVYQAKVKSVRATITLAAQTTSDTIYIGSLPAGSVFSHGIITSTVSLGTSTIAIGTAAVADKYRTSAIFTSIDTPTLFGKTAPMAASDRGFSSDEAVLITITTANLPASGTLVIELFYTHPN